MYWVDNDGNYEPMGKVTDFTLTAVAPDETYIDDLRVPPELGQPSFTNLTFELTDSGLVEVLDTLLNPGEVCKNCGAPVRGQYCEYCGTSYRRPMGFKMSIDGKEIGK